MKSGMFYLFETLGKKSVTDLYHQALGECCYGEELGFTGAHPAEHHFSTHYGIMPRVELFLAALSTRTTRLRLIPSVIVAALSDPVRLAEDSAMLDILSNGRFTYSIGAGYRKYEFAKLGVDVEENRSRLREAAEIAELAWKQEKFSYKGHHHQIEDLQIVPKPERKDGSVPEIWINTGTPDQLVWAAQRGYVVLPTAGFSVASFKKDRDTYVAESKQAGHNPAKIEAPFFKWIYVGETDQKAQETGQKAFLETIQAFFVGGERLIAQLTKRIQLPPEMMGDPNKLLLSPDLGAFVCGSPETVARQLRPFRDAGATYFIGGFNIGALPTEKVRRSMELYAKEVAPALA